MQADALARLRARARWTTTNGEVQVPVADLAALLAERDRLVPVVEAAVAWASARDDCGPISHSLFTDEWAEVVERRGRATERTLGELEAAVAAYRAAEGAG